MPFVYVTKIPFRFHLCRPIALPNPVLDEIKIFKVYRLHISIGFPPKHPVVGSLAPARPLIKSNKIQIIRRRWGSSKKPQAIVLGQHSYLVINSANM
jgi:hypothetical protein